MIIGSEVVEIIGKHGENCIEPVITYLKNLKTAMI
jgi:tryptophan synthase alpha subunit